MKVVGNDQVKGVLKFEGAAGGREPKVIQDILREVVGKGKGVAERESRRAGVLPRWQPPDGLPRGQALSPAQAMADLREASYFAGARIAIVMRETQVS